MKSVFLAFIIITNLIFSSNSLLANQCLNYSDGTKIFNNNQEKARKAALKTARRGLICSELKRILPDKTIQNYWVDIRNNILKESKLFIDKEKLVLDQLSDDQSSWLLKIEAKINRTLLKEKLQELRILPQKIEKNRAIVLYYPEQDNSLDLNHPLVQHSLAEINHKLEKSGFLSIPPASEILELRTKKNSQIGSIDVLNQSEELPQTQPEELEQTQPELLKILKIQEEAAKNKANLLITFDISFKNIKEKNNKEQEQALIKKQKVTESESLKETSELQEKVNHIKKQNAFYKISSEIKVNSYFLNSIEIISGFNRSKQLISNSVEFSDNWKQAFQKLSISAINSASAQLIRELNSYYKKNWLAGNNYLIRFENINDEQLEIIKKVLSQLNISNKELKELKEKTLTAEEEEEEIKHKNRAVKNEPLIISEETSDFTEFSFFSPMEKGRLERKLYLRLKSNGNLMLTKPISGNRITLYKP